ncbi:tyrosine-type recombinase/integrase [Draconibacterium orientale]|uniref:tyrosine-type recombinase/integrase n=1 Tax=Draconibacterium orientale TaxID=1168034 RepID=UPI0009DD5731|nr:tyrosine-type recombinase/integrase [Draconibacterium orientale]
MTDKLQILPSNYTHNNRRISSKRVYAYKFNYSFATNHLKQGVDIHFIQAWLGLESVKTTQRYTHVSEHNFKNYKNPLDELL